MMYKISKITPRLGGRRQKMGAVSRTFDRRSTDVLMSTIEYFASSSGKNIQSLMPQIRQMNPKYLGLVCDTLELAKIKRRGFGRNLLNMKLPNNKTVLEFLLPKIICAAKSEHKALDFACDVVNNADYRASQRFLAELSISNVLENPAMSEKFETARPMISEIAETMLKPPYYGNGSLDKFMDFIKILTGSNAKPDKVKLLKQFSDFVTKIFQKTKPVNVPKFVESDVSVQKIRENMKTLALMAQNFEKNNSKIDVVDFVLKNTNLK